MKSTLPNINIATSGIFWPVLAYAEYITRNAGLEEAQAGIKIAGRNINNLKQVSSLN